MVEEKVKENWIAAVDERRKTCYSVAGSVENLIMLHRKIPYG